MDNELDGCVEELSSSVRMEGGSSDDCAKSTVTLEEARQGLMKAISFLEAHSNIAGDCIASLWTVLKHIDMCYSASEQSSPAEGLTQRGTTEECRDSSHSEFQRGVEDQQEIIECTQGIVGAIQSSVLKSEVGSDKHNCNDNSDGPPNQTHHIFKGTDLHNDLSKTELQCSFCHQSFRKVGFLQRHMLEVHRANSDSCLRGGRSPSQMLAQNGANSEMDSTAFCKCLACDLHFATSKDLNKHRRDSKHYVCTVCADGFRSVTLLINHMNGHSEKCFMCTMCLKSFSVARSLVLHMKVHTGENLYECLQCGRKFILKADLKRHMRIHTVERPYACDVCSSKFYLPWELKTHFNRCHSEERRFLCNTCGKSFRSSGHLRQHGLVHSGEKPYACSVCGKRYRSSGGLHIHLRSHRGERPSRCSLCRKGFLHSSDLKRHMAIHTGEKPHQCNECGKRFTQASNLQTHMRTHTGQKPYKCPVCLNAFGHAVSLRGHLKLHEKGTETG